MFDIHSFTEPNRQFCDKANLCQGRHSYTCTDKSWQTIMNNNIFNRQLLILFL